MQKNTLQIATFGSDMQEGIAAGIRNFPVHKLVLLCYSPEKEKADDFARKLRITLGLPIMIAIVNPEDVVRDTMEKVGEIVSTHRDEFQQFLMNVSAGSKLIGCAALSAAFINGIKAFAIDSSGLPLLLPVIKLSFSEIISEPKINILKAIDLMGGGIESLDRLEETSGYGKPLLSYHIMGSKEAKGLVDLGLLDVEKGERGRITGHLTTVGKLLVNGSAIRQVQTTR